MKLPELKPCPFCGSEASFEHVPGQMGYNYDKSRIKCKNCFCKTDFKDTETWVQGQGTYSIRERELTCLAAYWNQRVELRETNHENP